MRVSKVLLASLALFTAASITYAAPVTVSYTVTGTSGNYTLDFSFTNNLTGTDQDIYFVGVFLDPSLGVSTVTGSPGSFDPTIYPTYTVSGLGGSDTIYDAVWLDPTVSDLAPGQTLSGFDVQVASATAPLAVPWFALATGTVPYTGTGSFTGDPYNPGFEGVAAPEPVSWSLLLAGICGFAVFRQGPRFNRTSRRLSACGRSRAA